MEYLVKKDDKYIFKPENNAKIVDLLTQYSYVKNTLKSIKNEILAEFLKNDIKSIETDDLVITVKDSYTRETFDSKKFRKDNEELYNKYINITKVKESLLIKCKNTK